MICQITMQCSLPLGSSRSYLTNGFDAALRRLRRKGLVEGRKPHLRVAASVAEATGTKAVYVEKRGRSKESTAWHSSPTFLDSTTPPRGLENQRGRLPGPLRRS